MLAGLDTTSNGLSRILYLLAQDQESQERLRTELLEARSRPVTEPNGANIPHDELMKLPYLDAVFRETMRLYPTIISTLPRILDQPIFIGGMELPPGVVVGMQNYVHHRDPVVFPDPESFTPERWLESPNLEAMEAALSESTSLHCLSLLSILTRY